MSTTNQQEQLQQIVENINSRFKNLMRNMSYNDFPVGDPRKTRASQRYRLEQDMAYLMREITHPTTPAYIVPKFVDQANQLVDFTASQLRAARAKASGN